MELIAILAITLGLLFTSLTGILDFEWYFALAPLVWFLLIVSLDCHPLRG